MSTQSTEHTSTMGSGNPNSNFSNTPTEQTIVRSHKCSSCNCAKQRFYERGFMFNMKNDAETYVIEYSGFECASCGFLMPFKTKEMAFGPGQFDEWKKQQQQQQQQHLQK